MNKKRNTTNFNSILISKYQIIYNFKSIYLALFNKSCPLINRLFNLHSLKIYFFSKTIQITTLNEPSFLIESKIEKIHKPILIIKNGLYFYQLKI